MFVTTVPLIITTAPLVNPTVPLIIPTVPLVNPTVPLIITTVPLVNPTVPLISTTVPIVNPTVPHIVPGRCRFLPKNGKHHACLMLKHTDQQHGMWVKMSMKMGVIHCRICIPRAS
jgi:hypothetical protein